MSRLKLQLASLAVAALAPICAAPTAAAQCRASELAKLAPSDREPFDRFGRAIAARGDFVVVGCPEDDAHGSNAGAAYVYRRAGAEWIEAAKLTAGDEAAANEEFGQSVALWNDVLVIGARALDSGGPYLSGAAYVFRFDGEQWLRETKLVASDAAEGDHFANSLAAHDGLIVVGALQDSHSGVLRPGSAYVFRFDGSAWVEEIRLGADVPEHGDHFGYAVATTGDAILIGARFDDFDDVIEGGAAYVFRHAEGQWRLEAMLTASDAGDGHRLGSSVSLSGDVALVGAPLWDGNGAAHSGAAYVFRRRGSLWVQEQSLPVEDGGNRFGAAVAIRSDLAVVGAPARNPDDPPPGEDGPFRVGAAYAYRFDGGAWNGFARLMASDADDEDQLGTSIALRGNLALVGTEHADAFSGAVYVFRGLLRDCNDNGARDVCDVAERASRDCDRNGLPDECQARVECVCPTDVDADDHVDAMDMIEVIEAWGTSDIFADVNADGTVDVDDLVAVILAWGPCP
jgi:hypothetical protein